VVAGTGLTVMHLGSLRRTVTSGEDGWYAVSSLPGNSKSPHARPLSDGRRLEFTWYRDAASGLRSRNRRNAGVHVYQGGTATISTEDATQVCESRTKQRGLPINGRTLQGLISLSPGVVATPAWARQAVQRERAAPQCELFRDRWSKRKFWCWLRRFAWTASEARCRR
jgi:hypothetical protein